jgi:adenylate cyclase
MDEPSQTRKLAAILAADVAGYSRLMGDDEKATVQTLTDYRKVFVEHIARHHGKVVDTTGDSVLAIFDSPVEAVGCATDIQQELARRNRHLADDRQMKFRIGINLGDVIVREDGTVYGDGVNIAARLESLGEPGGICVSSTISEHVENRLPVAFEFIGEQSVKNIAKPIRAYRVTDAQRVSSVTQNSALTPARRNSSARARNLAFACVLLIAAGKFAWRFYSHNVIQDDPILALPKGPSIAVLPFTNLSGDPAQDYFSDGITEQLISELARFRGLYVIARNSTFKYKGHTPDVREVGREFGVGYVLEGSVRRSGATLRVTAQLLDAGTGAHLWAETYDRSVTGADVFALQDDVTSKVTANIAGPQGRISQAGLENTSKRSAPKNIDSYDCVLRA